MHSEKVCELLKFHLNNIALLRFDEDSIYEDIISPFTRLYLITKGTGYLIIGGDKITLEAGKIYLIPRYTSCTYFFGRNLEHYYIHFTIDHQDGLSPYNLFPIINELVASELDYFLIKRVLELNPDLQLPHHHPDIYQRKLWLNKKVTFHSPSQYLETIGILGQLFSRFVGMGQNYNTSELIMYNIQSILIYIQENIERDIRVEELAEMAYLSKDHFSKVFKSIFGVSPGNFVINKRIERAQFLLLTTDLSQREISEKTGFKNAAYLSRIFKSRTSYTPDSYRKQRGL